MPNPARRIFGPHLALLILLALGGAGLAAEIRVGATVQVKPNSIWFQDMPTFQRWQALKRAGNAKALTAFEEKTRRERDAWQFVNPLTVKILKVDPKQNRVEVEMLTAGRLQGTQWWLDTEALSP